GDVRSAGDSRLCGIADGGFPDFFSGSSVDCDEAAIASANKDFAVPDGNASVRARRIGTIDGHAKSNARVEFPEEFSGGSIHGIDFGLRRADVGDAIDDDWLGDDAHGAVDIEIPCEAEPGDVLIVYLREGAEMFAVESAAVEEPICAACGI